MNLRFPPCILGLLCAAALCASASDTPPTGALPSQPPAYLNVRDYGAVGDGAADDTPAIAKAIDDGAKLKLPVCLPRGSYKVTKPLVIDKQSIIGSEPGAWNADSAPMPMISVAHNTGPALTMRDGSSIHGIGFVYDPRTFDKYPPAILMDGQGLSISNVRLQYCDDGIITAENAGVGRLNIENVFIVSPGGTALFVNRTYDIPTVRNIEVWNNQNRPNVTAFKFGRNDGIRASHLFAFNVSVGFELANDPEGGTWGTFAECGTDATGIGWKADGKTGHTVSITGGYYWDHQQSLMLNNPNVCVRMSNCELQSNGSPVITATGCHHLLLTGCRIGRAYVNKDTPYFDLQAVDALTMSNCVVGAFGPLFKIGPGLKQASIQGNVFESSPHARIVEDKHGKGSEIIFADNAGMKPVPSKDGAAK